MADPGYIELRPIDDWYAACQTYEEQALREAEQRSYRSVTQAQIDASIARYLAKMGQRRLIDGPLFQRTERGAVGS